MNTLGRKYAVATPFGTMYTDDASEAARFRQMADDYAKRSHPLPDAQGSTGKAPPPEAEA